MPYLHRISNAIHFAYYRYYYYGTHSFLLIYCIFFFNLISIRFVHIHTAVPVPYLLSNLKYIHTYICKYCTYSINSKSKIQLTLWNESKNTNWYKYVCRYKCTYVYYNLAKSKSNMTLRYQYWYWYWYWYYKLLIPVSISSQKNILSIIQYSTVSSYFYTIDMLWSQFFFFTCYYSTNKIISCRLHHVIVTTTTTIIIIWLN